MFNVTILVGINYRSLMNGNLQNLTGKMKCRVKLFQDKCESCNETIINWVLGQIALCKNPQTRPLLSVYTEYHSLSHEKSILRNTNTWHGIMKDITLYTYLSLNLSNS